jgi:hypothetical protein
MNKKLLGAIFGFIATISLSTIVFFMLAQSLPCYETGNCGLFKAILKVGMADPTLVVLIFFVGLAGAFFGASKA